MQKQQCQMMITVMRLMMARVHPADSLTVLAADTGTGKKQSKQNVHAERTAKPIQSTIFGIHAAQMRIFLTFLTSQGTLDPTTSLVAHQAHEEGALGLANTNTARVVVIERRREMIFDGGHHTSTQLQPTFADVYLL
jgi:hypothetical protein